MRGRGRAMTVNCEVCGQPVIIRKDYERVVICRPCQGRANKAKSRHNWTVIACPDGDFSIGATFLHMEVMEMKRLHEKHGWEYGVVLESNSTERLTL